MASKLVWHHHGKVFSKKYLVLTCKHNNKKFIVCNYRISNGTGTLHFFDVLVNVEVYYNTLNESMLPSLKLFGKRAAFHRWDIEGRMDFLSCTNNNHFNSVNAQFVCSVYMNPPYCMPIIIAI